MNWRKETWIYDPENHMDQFAKRMKYGANPVPIWIREDLFRIFYNVRDEQNRSYITYLDYDIVEKKIISLPGKLLVGPGPRGTFDDCGCSLGSVLDLGDKCYIYYLGWNLPRNVPWMNTIGMAVYDKKSNSCEKISPAPIMDRSSVDPLSISYPFVLKGNTGYQMWYGSNLTWGNTTPENYDFEYVIKHAESDDGIHFHRDGRICIQGNNLADRVFARPAVLLEDDLYKMWYTYRGETYRIGYAESRDGLNWTRMDDKAGIEADALSARENGEICYPFVFRHLEKLYMLYCGRRYGLTGFGLAVMADDERAGTPIL